jgi:hypothetical protein
MVEQYEQDHRRPQSVETAIAQVPAAAQFASNFIHVSRDSCLIAPRRDRGKALEQPNGSKTSPALRVRRSSPNFTNQVDGRLANQDRDVGNDDILVVQENEVGGARSQWLENDQAIVGRMNVDDT